MKSFSRPRVVLSWLARASRRNRSSFTSFAGNNLNYTAVVLMFMLDPAAAGVLLVVMGLIVVLPLSSDPLRAIPPVRMNLWPLEASERRLLRVLSPLLSPMTWIVAALALWKRVSTGLAALAAGVVLTGLVLPGAASLKSGSPWRLMPRFPGPLNHLIRKNLREMLSTLDFFCAALISLAALLWRVSGQLPPAALFPLTVVTVLALSTCALSLFGLEGSAGLTRLRLLPLRGWQVLVAKDAAFLLIALVLALPLSIPGAFASALIALAFGHRTSLAAMQPQMRWRFQTGPSLGDALLQILPTVMAGAAVVYSSPLFLIPCLAACVGSVIWYGRQIDRVWR